LSSLSLFRRRELLPLMLLVYRPNLKERLKIPKRKLKEHFQ
jgi:hypothetical protein